MRRFGEYIATTIYLFFTMLTLFTWHPVIVLTRRGPRALHEWIIAIGCKVLLLDLWWVGGSFKLFGKQNLPAVGPVIVVCNHQSLLDIPVLLWAFRRYPAKFIAKKELGKGFPCVSYVLRTGGSALIDRKDPKQALPEIQALGERVKAGHFAGCIFPEGTRAKDGVMKPFKSGGLLVLMKQVPEAPIIPVTISGAWKLMRYKMWPVPFGMEARCTIFPPISRSSGTDEQLVTLAESVIRAGVENHRASD